MAPPSQTVVPAQQSGNNAAVQEEERIIAELCAGAPDNIRNCLRKYTPGKQTWEIEALFKQARKQLLVDTLHYLGLKEMEKYKAEALPHELICRIQNLLPDTCQLCKAVYCVKRADNPIVSCVRCGQGCHNACFLQIMGKTDQELTEENNYGANIVNPYTSLGLYYICGHCRDEVVPQKDGLKVKSKASTQSASQTGSQVQSQTATNPEVAPDHSQSTVDRTNQTDTQVLEGNTGEDADIPRNEDRRVEGGESAMLLSSPTQRLARQSQRTPSTVQNPPVTVCKFYRQGRCKHGISVKKDGNCSYSHPKPCRKFLTNGNRRQRGCTLGTQCQDFHPKMCNSSLKEPVCYHEDCQYIHIKGTKRSNDSLPNHSVNQLRPQQNQAAQNPPAASSYAQAARFSQTSSRPTSSDAQDNFLCEFRKMTDQIQSITSKLQQLEYNFNMCIQQQTMFPQQTPRLDYTQPQHPTPLQIPQQQLVHSGSPPQQPQVLQRHPQLVPLSH